MLMKLTSRKTWTVEKNEESDQKRKKESEEYEIVLEYTLELSSTPEAERRSEDSMVEPVEKVWLRWWAAEQWTQKPAVQRLRHFPG
jgi:sulfur transfer protein SufE